MPTEPNQTRKTLSPINSTTWMLVVLSILGLIFAGSVFLATAPGAWFKQNMNWLFAADTVQLWWYVTRAAGIIAYLLLWLSTAWGLVVPAKILDPLIQRWATFDFHQFISLLAIGFLGLHIGVLALDRYLPYSGLQILVPFLSPYRPLWVGIGVISFYLILLVTVTYYIRGRIGTPAFRAIHVLSLVAYLGATLHGIYSGTDSPLAAMQLLYEVTGLVVLFLTVYWLVMLYQKRLEAKREQKRVLAQHHRRHSHSG